MKESLVPVSTPHMFAQVVFIKTSPSVSWMTFINGPPSSVIALMKLKNFSQTTGSGSAARRILEL
jgi:hypothetical protein